MTRKINGLPSDDKFIPAAIRPILDRAEAMQDQLDDARAELAVIESGIASAETRDVVEEAEAIVAGSKIEQAGKHERAARAAVDDQRRHVRALQIAVERTGSEAAQALTDASDEIRRIADAEFEKSSGEYLMAVEQLADARAAWLHSIAARKWADSAASGVGDIDHYAPNIDPDALKLFRGELSISRDRLFAPPKHGGMQHHAHVVRTAFDQCGVPSYDVGNTLTVLDCAEVGSAMAILSERLGWLPDGDGVSTANGDHVTIVKVAERVSGMRVSGAARR